MTSAERILIIGGGIGGLTTAAAPRRKGLAPEIIERNPEWDATGTGLALLATGVRALHAVDLDGAVAQAGVFMRRWRYCNTLAEVLCETDLETLWGEVGPTTTLSLAPTAFMRRSARSHLGGRSLATQSRSSGAASYPSHPVDWTACGS